MASLSQLAFDPANVMDAFERGRTNGLAEIARRQIGNSLATGDYGAAANAAFQTGQFGTGLGLSKIANDAREQQVKIAQTKAAADSLGAYFENDKSLSSMAPLARSNPEVALDLLKAQRSSQSNGAEYGLQPVWGVDGSGNQVLYQINKGGGEPRQVQFPNGVRPTPGVQFLNTGTGFIAADRKTGITQGGSPIPIDNAGRVAAEVDAKARSDARSSYRSMISKMPGLEKVVAELGSLANDATYTKTGQVVNAVRRELGMAPTSGAVARAAYISMVDNQILPLLRDTFGAQFTQREGETLRETLGDPNKTPLEKKAVLKSFIEQKRRDVEALATQAGIQAGYPGADGITNSDIGNFPGQIPPPNEQSGGGSSIDELLQKYGP